MERYEADWLGAFLYYGFIPRILPEFASHCWAAAAATGPEPTDDGSLAARGAEIFRSVCADETTSHDVVPLSGGFDSRLILSVLRERWSADHVTAVTFGTPGTLDFECAQEVARHYGVRHETIDLSGIEIEQDRLEEVVCRGARWTPIFEAFANYVVPEHAPAGSTVWSGYMAGTINGSRASTAGDSWQSARGVFADLNRFTRSVDLAPPGFDPVAVLPEAPMAPGSRLTNYEQLHIGLRYLCRYKPTLIPPGCDYRTPFVHHDWVDYMLSAPAARRAGCKLYREVIEAIDPVALDLPLKDSIGLAASAPGWQIELRRLPLRARTVARRIHPRAALGTDPRINYIDFDRGFRRRPRLRELVYENLQDLQRRHIVDWLDLDGIWREHLGWHADHGDALRLLTALEINLKVCEREGSAPPGAFEPSLSDRSFAAT